MLNRGWKRECAGRLHLATLAEPAMENWLRAFQGTPGLHEIGHKQLAGELGKEALTPFEMAFMGQPTMPALSNNIFYVAENAASDHASPEVTRKGGTD